MAYLTLYGPWFGSSSTGGRGRFRVEISDLPAIDSNTSSVNVRSRWFVEFNQITWDSSNSFDPNGSYEEAPRAVNIGTASAPVTSALIFDKTISWPLRYGNRSEGIQVYGTLSGINNVGTTIVIDQWFDLPARPYKLPLAPKSFAATFQSDTRANTSWVANYTGATPWSKLYVGRTPTDSWSDAVNASGELGWDALSWSDAGLKANSRYLYRISAKNSAGRSPYAYAPSPVYTTPAAPSNVVAAKQTDGSIKITATNNAPWANAFEISVSPDGATWTVLSSTKTALDHTVTSPNNAVTHRYRWRAKTPDGKWSDYSTTSNIVQLLAKPNPSTWTPIDEAFDATKPITTPFTYNSVDTTPMTAYEIQTRTSADNGTTWTAWASTGKVVSATPSRAWAANAFPQNVLVDRQVRVWGAFPNPSDWSPSGVFRTSSTPLVGIASPTTGTVIPGKSVTVSWNYTDPEGTAQSSARITLQTPSDEVLGSWTVSGAVSSFVIPYGLEDGKSYEILVAVRDGHGLWSAEDSTTISVTYFPPRPPIVEVLWDEQRAAAIISIINPAPNAGEPEAIYNRIFRDGVLIADNVIKDTTFTDRLPLLEGSTYAVEAVSDLPSSASTVVELAVSEFVWDRFWINSGDSFELVAGLRGNVKRTRTRGRNRVVEFFSGREIGVETIGEGRISKLSLSGTLVLSETPTSAFFDVVESPNPIIYRDRYEKVAVSIEPIPASQNNDALADLSFSMEEVDYPEPVL